MSLALHAPSPRTRRLCGALSVLPLLGYAALLVLGAPGLFEGGADTGLAERGAWGALARVPLLAAAWLWWASASGGPQAPRHLEWARNVTGLALLLSVLQAPFGWPLLDALVFALALWWGRDRVRA